jgi:chromosome segregation ATPase
VQLREGRERLAREMADLGGRADEQSRRFAQVQRDQQTRSEWLERRTAELDDREQQLVEAEEELSVRQCQWAEADLLLAESRREVERMTEELEGHRQEQMTELTAARRQWVEEQRHREAELTRRQEALERHAEQLDHRRAVLEQSQQDVTALHREALEMRLATEELWAQLTGAVPPAELHEALGETRARLAGHYRLASAEIEARKAELQALRDDLAAQHDRLREQVAESEAWAAGRLDELRQREAAIESSRAELEKLRTEQQRQFAQWRGQRERWEFERRHWMLEQHSGAPPGPHLPALGAPGEVSMTLGRQQAAHLNM